MAGDPSNVLPYRWAPGHSGNANGYSEGRRQARRLRQALDVILGEELPPAWLVDRLPEDVRAACPPGVTFAELIALRLVWAAATATKPAAVIAAAQLILQAQGKPDAMDPAPAAGPPVLEASEDRRRDVAAQLGVDLEDPAPEAPRDVH